MSLAGRVSSFRYVRVRQLSRRYALRIWFAMHSSEFWRPPKSEISTAAFLRSFSRNGAIRAPHMDILFLAFYRKFKSFFVYTRYYVNFSWSISCSLGDTRLTCMWVPTLKHVALGHVSSISCLGPIDIVVVGIPYELMSGLVSLAHLSPKAGS